MANGGLTFLSYICTFIGLISSAAYAVSFYTTRYNEIYLAGQSGFDETDISYTLGIVECAVAGAIFVMATVAFTTPTSPSKRTLMVTCVFFAAAAVLTGATSVLRAWNLGLLGDDMSKTCSDTGIATGCPTTRFEFANDRDIVFTEPSGGDCVFWFWGANADSMKRLTDIEASLSKKTSSTYRGLLPSQIETYMDWSDATSYGWRDDPDKLATLTADTDTDTMMVNKRHNMQQLMEFQKNVDIPESDKLSGPPSLAYCWYWGCNSVCHPHRYLINRLWLVLSASLLFLNLIGVCVSTAAWRGVNDGKNKIVSETVGTNDIESFPVIKAPVRGRRKRQENPSLLLF